MRLAFFSSSLLVVWGGLRDEYCLGGANPDQPMTLPAIDGYELKLIQVVTRHGARTPIVALPGVSPNWTCAETSLSVLSPNNGQQEINVSRLYRKVYLSHESYQNCAFGQLTVLGAQQHSLIGRGLRQALVEQKFLSETLSKSEIYIRSTDFERTQQSAQSLLLSLYPPQEGERREVGLVDINTVTSDEETMVPNFDVCPYLYSLREQALKKQEWIDCVNRLEPTITILQKLLGAAPQNANDKADWLERAADTFSMIECHNYTLPTALTEDHRQKLYNATDLLWWSLYNNSEFSELTLGAFLLDLHTNMETYVNASSTSSSQPLAKFRLYSGHDTTLAPLMGALGVASRKWIPLASQVMFQLLQSSSNHSSFAVRVLFNGKLLDFPECAKKGECLWSEWMGKMKQLRARLDKANKSDAICFSVAVAPACRNIVTALRDYVVWWPLLVLLLLSCLVIVGCAFRVRRLQKVERFRPVEMAEISESR